MSIKLFYYHYIYLNFYFKGELADYIDAQVRESQTKKTFDALKNKVHGLSVSLVCLQVILLYYVKTSGSTIHQKIMRVNFMDF